MQVMSVHERLIPRPIADVFADLEAVGTPADRIWPSQKIPFHRTPGPLAIGVTEERHGVIRGRLESYQANARIIWRVDLRFLRGTHGFEVREVDASRTLARHVLDAKLAWWFAPVWALKMKGIHDRIVEGLLDRLVDPRAGGQPSANRGRRSAVGADLSLSTGA